MTITILPIVEGHGEVEAVPILLRRLIATIDPGLGLVVTSPLRRSSSTLRKPGELERAVEFAARLIEGTGAILILLDCDWADACPAQDGPRLLARAQTARPDCLISVVLARMEYEAWFLAAAESLRGRRGLALDMPIPPRPESIRDAKGWLSEQMGRNRRYEETSDQAALTAIFDLDAARRAHSFDKLYREVSRLIERLQQ